MNFFNIIVPEIVNAMREIKEVSAINLNLKKDNIIFCGSTNPNFLPTFNNLYLFLEHNLIWFDHIKIYPAFAYGIKLKLPVVVDRTHFMELNYDVDIDSWEKEYVLNNKHLNWAYNNIMSTYPGNNPDCVIRRVLLIEQYWKAAYNILKPKLCIFWNPFVSINKIAVSVAQSQNIPVLYAENGNFPGTVCYETWGGIGESRPAMEYEYFRSLPISGEEINYSEKVLNFLCRSGLNRNIQKKTKKNWISNLKNGRPIVLFAGQNDFECGIVPYNEDTKKYQSPGFSSSYKAMVLLSELAKKNDWNLIYKSHPIFAKHEKDYIPSNVIYVTEGDINEIIDMSNVVVTILSTSSYIALIRQKPVVMLGYTQLRGQECTYEAFDRDSVEEQIKNALKYGFTPKQQQAFTEHAARMNKYYLFDSGQPRDIYYGQSIEKAIEFIDKAINGKAEF